MLCTGPTSRRSVRFYLKPFEISVKEGGCDAVMSSFNYIGTEWAADMHRFARPCSVTSGDSAEWY